MVKNMPMFKIDNISRLRQKLYYFSQLIRLDKPIGSLLLLWPALWGLWVAAEGQPSAKNVMIFVLGVFVMRSAGCIINDIADRDIDPLVERTQNRPLAAKHLSLKEAIGFFVVLVAIGLLLVFQLNNQAIYYSIGALAFIITYPFLKRITHLPQFFLGATFSWAIPMGFVAEIGETTLVCWLLMAANLCWVTAYDTMYGMVDRDDDVKIGVKSTAVLFAKHDILIVMMLQIITLVILTVCGLLLDLSTYYYLGLFMALGFGIYQYNLYKTRQREKCFQAFLNNAWFGACVFLGILLSYLA